MKTQDELLIELVKEVPELVLTGSRYFGTANRHSDWDFMLAAGLEYQLPSAFFLQSENHGQYSDPCVEAVYVSTTHNAHVQIVTDMETKLRAQEILKSTGALVGLDKSQQKAVWTAVVAALLANKPPSWKQPVMYDYLPYDLPYDSLDIHF
jgi:hypothetical protein